MRFRRSRDCRSSSCSRACRPIRRREVKENELEQNYYGILSLQGAIGEDLNYQVAAFSRYYELKYSPDPIGDLIYNGVAAKILHTGFINGVQEDTSYKLGSQHTLRAGFYMSGEAIELDDHAQTFPAKDGMQTSPTSVLDRRRQQSDRVAAGILCAGRMASDSEADDQCSGCAGTG